MSTKNKKVTAPKAEAKKSVYRSEFVFGRNNYMLMIVGLVVIALGFVLMYGGKEDIQSFRRVTLAPIVVVAGFIIEVFAALLKPTDDKSEAAS
jgi:uncharacterized membrane protein